MAKPEQIEDPALRTLVGQARDALRSGDSSSAVRACADAYQRYLRAHPALERFVKQGGRLSPGNWPRLGTRLTLAPGEPPQITFSRERFAFSEAATIYEFTIDSIVAGQQFSSDGA
jgi:hypothetical protein